MKKLLRSILLAGLLCLPGLAFADGFHSKLFPATGADTGLSNLFSGISYHKLTWNGQGTVATCTVALDSSVDGVSWTAGGAITGQSCTSNSSSTIVNVTANFVRINVTALSGGGTISVTWNGYVNNPSSTSTTGNVNGVMFPTTGSSFDALPILTGSNTIGYYQINSGSNCGDSTHALSYNQTTHLIGCQAIAGSGGTPTLDVILSPVANVSFTAPATNTYSFLGTAPGSGSGAGTAAGTTFTFTAPAGGATTGSGTTGGAGGGFSLGTGAGGSGSGGTNASGGGGGTFLVALGAGGAKVGSGTAGQSGYFGVTGGSTCIGKTDQGAFCKTLTIEDTGLQGSGVLEIRNSSNVQKFAIDNNGSIINALNIAGFTLSANSKFNADSNGRFTLYNNASPTNGQLLIGDTAGVDYLPATITAGVGVTVTNAAHAITIASANTMVPLEACSPDTSGNAFWQVTALTNWRDGHWEWNDAAAFGGTDVILYCKARVPHILPTGSAKIVLSNLSANDGTASHTMTFKTCDIAVSTTVNAGSLTCAATQNFTTTSTAYAPADLTFAVQSTLAADNQLIVAVHATAESSLAANVLLESLYLEFQ